MAKDRSVVLAEYRQRKGTEHFAEVQRRYLKGMRSDPERHAAFLARRRARYNHRRERHLQATEPQASVSGVVYALREPNGGAIRYVGITVQPLETRRKQHVYYARRGRRTHLGAWLRSLGDDEPEIMILETVVDGDLGVAEQRWIARLRAGGCRLTNLTTGGEGAWWAERRAELDLERAVALQQQQNAA